MDERAARGLAFRRRDSEGNVTAFRNTITSKLGMTDLQGLLIGESGEFTEAVEAFEVEGLAHDALLNMLLPTSDLTRKVRLAKAIGVPFSVWIHGTDDGEIIRAIQLDVDEGRLGGVKVVTERRCTEDKFIEWWAEKKKTPQTKIFRKRYIQDSYFDKLLESHGMVWGGNIDGAIFAPDGSVEAIVEIRCTEKNPIETYDPSRYYKEDTFTWQPVLKLSRDLGIPCVLLTFKKEYKDGETGVLGVAGVLGNDDNGLKYLDAKPPCNNLVHSADEVRRFVLDMKIARAQLKQL